MHAKNSIFGEAMNPIDFDRSCGNGGDAALVGSRCVPFAISSDKVGGLRIPAAFSGVFSFKPTANRFTKLGLGSGRKLRFEEFNYLRTAVGPIG